MKRKLQCVFTFLFVFIVQMTFAQEQTIRGTVTDEAGLPLPGVNIVIKGTSTGVQTDFDGNYAIEATQGDVLVYSFIGLKTSEYTVGDNDTINVVMTADSAQLDEVIVTAQGIKREQKALGYAVSTVDSEQINQKSEGDIGRILQGKAAGVNITATNGVSGSGTNFIIRGYSSISGSNQPLFVVDGVPFDGGANEQTSFFDGVTESSRFLDLDPNNIEDVKVLKGLSATVLYGERGRNGVVLITTKNSGEGGMNKKMEVNVSQSLFFSEPHLPDYTQEYAGGFHQSFGFFFSSWGSKYGQDISSNSLFRGIAPDGTTLIAHPFSRLSDTSLTQGFPDLVDSDYRLQPYNSVEKFFRTGVASTTSVNVSGGSENTSFNLNYGYLDDRGFTPGNTLRRNNFGLGGNAKLSNNFTVNATMNYSNTNYETPPIAASAGSGTVGDGASVFGDVMYTPSSIDLMGMPFQTPDGRSIYYRSGNDIQNPRWTVANSKVTQETERIFGSANLMYSINDNLNLSFTSGLDTYTEFSSYGQNKGGVDGDPTGIYRTVQTKNTILNNNLQFIGDYELSSDFDFNFVVGGTTRRDEFKRDGLESTQQLAFGVLEHYNFVNSSSVNSFTGGNIAFFAEENQIGVYGDATIGYQDYAYLNVSARNDWSSTLEKENYSLFYPGTSLSFIPTAAFDDLRSDAVNYLKLRLGYGSSAGFPSPYGTRNSLALNARLFVDGSGNVVTGNSVSNRLGNPNLKPERVSEFEIGMDSRFFDNRLNLNVSVFKKESTDLITDQNLDPSTGFTVTRINAGKMENKGIELDMSLALFRTDDFNWNISGNFYADEPIVTELPEGTEQIALTSTIGGRPANYAIEGEPYGVLRGSSVLRDANGNRVVGSDGYYLEDTNLSILGDPNPDWTTTGNTNVNYKGITFGASVQYRHGGDIFSQTAGATEGRGVVEVPVNREDTFILPGVLQDGSPNNIQITATDVYFNNKGFGPNELQIYDGSTLRLAEVSLGYNFSKEFLEKTPFGAFSIQLTGSNLWYRAFNFPEAINFDTNTLSTGVGNGQGIDYITGPSARRMGFSVKASF
ncbi:SusC/RagA family TonB-linked outer membrane protein [Christiangramia salexigens]|uniref:SusC/RagA family TonB-linked outer membrane protein n=1 Tax=Christiangramia salexigens TaxID=1913577 RepID=A0A1L3J7R6_9FLAO|nr:SusC/RagA family TonB-linked outer membrane protein [Christiangramia salexigens]APG61153.1 SusC/RagA family TonB-linked outer membrane protein [Christiangramia salexigens]